LTSLSSLVAWAALGTLAVAACGGDDVAAAPPSDDAGVGSDGAPVDPPDGAAACAPGTADCNGNPADGCETVVTTRTACAACGVACNASQWCAPEGCRSPTAKPFARVPAGVLGATSDAAG